MLNCGDTPRGSWSSLDLRQSQHDPLLPHLLDRVYPDTVEQINEQKRLEDRQVIICKTQKITYQLQATNYQFKKLKNTFFKLNYLTLQLK